MCMRRFCNKHHMVRSYSKEEEIWISAESLGVEKTKAYTYKFDKVIYAWYSLTLVLIYWIIFRNGKILNISNNKNVDIKFSVYDVFLE